MKDRNGALKCKKYEKKPPHLPAVHSCRVQGCAAVQCNDHHADVYGSFVQSRTEEAAVPKM